MTLKQIFRQKYFKKIEKNYINPTLSNVKT